MITTRTILLICVLLISTFHIPKIEARPSLRLSPKRSLLVILSNVKNANIEIDGILAGKVNNRAEITPGTHIISVNAKGYESARIKVNIKRRVEAKYLVNLKKAPHRKIPHIQGFNESSRLSRISSRYKMKNKDVDMFADKEPVYYSNRVNKNKSRYTYSNNNYRSKYKNRSINRHKGKQPVIYSRYPRAKRT